MTTTQISRPGHVSKTLPKLPNTTLSTYGKALNLSMQSEIETMITEFENRSLLKYRINEKVAYIDIMNLLYYVSYFFKVKNTI